MTIFKTISAAAMLSATIATPVFAQTAIQEPGAYAFYHSNGDVLESGVSRPREPMGAFAYTPSGAYAAMDGRPVASSCARYRS